jgi:hypothetical protein
MQQQPDPAPRIESGSGERENLSDWRAIAQKMLQNVRVYERLE